MKYLKDVTLISVDGVGNKTKKLKTVFNICSKDLTFCKKIIVTSNKEEKPEYDIDIQYIEPLNYKEYNKFCILDLAKYASTSHILLVQNDGFISNPDMWSDEFLEYDYIGPPWDHEIVPNPFPWTSNGTKNMVGCGGFSLRSKKLLQICSEYDPYFVNNQVLTGMNEDIFVCVYARPALESKKCKFPDVELANRFAKGSIPFKIGVTDTCFGFHSADYIPETLHKFNLKHNTNYKITDII